MSLILSKVADLVVETVLVAQWLLDFRFARVIVAVGIRMVTAADFTARNTAKSCQGAWDGLSRQEVAYC